MSADLDFGKLALKFWGEFDLTMQYETLDCVYYDFSTYLAINTPNVGEDPNSSSAWMLMCQGYGLVSEQEVAEGVVDNKAISAKELKNNKATSEEVLAGTGDKIITVANKVELAKLLTSSADLETRQNIGVLNAISPTLLVQSFARTAGFYTVAQNGWFRWQFEQGEPIHGKSFDLYINGLFLSTCRTPVAVSNYGAHTDNIMLPVYKGDVIEVRKIGNPSGKIYGNDVYYSKGSV